MKIYKVYELYGGESYERSVFADRKVADKYCEIVNEAYPGHFVSEQDFKLSDWDESKVFRYLELYADETHEIEVTKHINMEGEIRLQEDSFHFLDEDYYSFTSYFKVDSFDNYDKDEINKEFKRRFLNAMKLHIRGEI